MLLLYPGKGADYCNYCVDLGLPLANFNKHTSKLDEVLYTTMPVSVARYSADENALRNLRYLLPVSCKTSCFYVHG